MRYRVIVAAAVSGWLCASGNVLGQAQQEAKGRQPATAQAQATAELKDPKGQTVGRARLSDTPNGVLIRLNMEGAPAGERAFHIHQVGQCDAPTFKSAGDHLNPTKASHGFLQAQGPHAGDLPNVHVPKDGRLTVEILARNVTLQSGANSLLDGDGSSLVMHVKPDDYRTDPSGDAGDRIACGVIQK